MLPHQPRRLLRVLLDGEPVEERLEAPFDGIAIPRAHRPPISVTEPVLRKGTSRETPAALTRAVPIAR